MGELEGAGSGKEEEDVKGVGGVERFDGKGGGPHVEGFVGGVAVAAKEPEAPANRKDATTTTATCTSSTATTSSPTSGTRTCEGGIDRSASRRAEAEHGRGAQYTLHINEHTVK